MLKQAQFPFYSSEQGLQTSEGKICHIYLVMAVISRIYRDQYTFCPSSYKICHKFCDEGQINIYNNGPMYPQYPIY